MKVTLEINTYAGETFEDALRRHVEELLRGTKKISGEKFDPPPQKNDEDRTTCPDSLTVAEIHTTGSTEINAEPAPDFKIEVAPKTRKPRAKKSEIVTKDEQIALVQAAIDPQDALDELVFVGDSDVTHDDLRKAVGDFTKQYGIARAQALVPRILGCAIVEVPNTQKDLIAAILKLKNYDDMAVLSVESDEEEVIEVTHATEDDVREALYNYAHRYDGGTDKMVFTPQDGPRILQTVFGEKCTAIRHIPKDSVSYGKALDAINTAINENWYQREVKL